jgi:hypothetical protein
MNNEILKDVVGYEGLYVVSNQGNIYSLNYKHTGKVEKLSPKITKWGYLQVCLYKNGEVKHCLIHRLVAETFIPNPLGLPQINHIDEDKTNNRAENLEWCTNQYNSEYSLAKQVEQYDLNGNLINVWKSFMEIERCLGYFHSYISACCLGKYKQAYGYIWKYK